jgi:hypothetical protein
MGKMNKSQTANNSSSIGLRSWQFEKRKFRFF